MNSKQVSVDFDNKINKFVIVCPFWANDLIKNLPSARWNKSGRAWHAPLTRKNAEGIELNIGPYAEITESATKAIEKAKQALVLTNGEMFPFWYPFKTDPDPLQFVCMRKLYPLKAAAIFAWMGTGKSKMAIDLTVAHRMEGHLNAMAVVCKLTLRDNWIEQFDLHCPIPASIHLPETTERRAFDKWRAESHDFKVLIVGVESLSQGKMNKMLEDYVYAAGKTMMVVDESHLIASHDAIRAEECVKVGLQTEYRLAMTGTPLRDSPLNLHMQFEFLDPNIIGIGDYYAFRNRYAVMGGYRDPKTGKPKQVIGYQNVDELAETVAPYIFQISKEEAKKMLPKKHPQRRVIPMMKEQRELYDEIKRDEAYTVDGEEQVMQTVLETCLRLHQVCGGFKVKKREVEKTVKGEKRIKKVYDPVEVMPWSKNPKILELKDILDECDDVAVIWCAYKPEIEAVATLLKTVVEAERIAYYHGGINDTDRDMYDKGFKSGKYKYMLANQQTGSMGLTWVEPELVVYYSNTNKMIDRVQSEERTHRRGLVHDVTYIDLLMEKSIDITLEHSVKNKLDLAQYIEARIYNATLMQKVYDGEVGIDTHATGMV